MVKNLSYLGTEKLIYKNNKNNKNIKTCLFPKVEAINLSRSGFLEAEGFWFTPGSGKPAKYYKLKKWIYILFKNYRSVLSIKIQSECGPPIPVLSKGLPLYQIYLT